MAGHEQSLSEQTAFHNLQELQDAALIDIAAREA
jgi:hypothetical protein